MPSYFRHGLWWLIFWWLFPNLGHAQLTIYPLDGDKPLRIKQGSEMHIDLTMTGPMLDTASRSFYGYLIGRRPKSLDIVPVTETKYLLLTTGLSRHENIGYDQIPDLPPMSLDPEEIIGFKYRSPRARGLSQWGGALILLGGLSTLVAAPLISINYREGSFNGQRYFRWAGYSLGVTGLGVIGSWLGKYRRVRFKPDESGRTKRYYRWELPKMTMR